MACKSVTKEAWGNRFEKLSSRSVGPPNAEIIRAKHSAARPSVRAWTIFPSPSFASLANPPRVRSCPPSATVTSLRRGKSFKPHKNSNAFFISSELPATGARGCSISVRSAAVLQPVPFAPLTKERASVRASEGSLINAPFPILTSRTKPSKPAASFFERMEAVIRSILSTVEVISRMAYSRLSAGAIPSPAPTMAQPTLATIF